MFRQIGGFLILTSLLSSCVYEHKTPVPCSFIDVSLSEDVAPILNDHSCTSCHSSAAASGGVVLDSFQGIRSALVNDRLIKSIEHASGVNAMPRGRQKLPDCEILLIKQWVTEGAKDN